MASEKSPNISVDDRLKQSMAKLKSNKLTLEKDKNKSTLTATSKRSETVRKNGESSTNFDSAVANLAEERQAKSKIGTGSSRVQAWML